MKHIALAFSGGLDTSFCLAYLQSQGYAVTTVTVDTGGFSAADLQSIADRAQALGAASHHVIDAKVELFNRFASYLIKGNILRGGVYPLCVGVERTLQAEKLVEFASEIGAAAVAHGCTGAGNDQVRFDIAIRCLNPEIHIEAPIRELALSRAEEVSFLKQRGVHFPQTKGKYSINQGILGVTIGGGETHNSFESIPDDAYLITKALKDTPNEPEIVTIHFDCGLPVSYSTSSSDVVTATGAEILAFLNTYAGAHGVGRGIHIGDTVLGIKGRIAFEAPGALTLITAHRELEKLVLTKWQHLIKEQVSQWFGTLLHEGLWYNPAMRDVEALLDSSQRFVSGTVRVKLFKGNAIVEGVQSPHSLMSVRASYGEGSSLWDGKDAAGFCKIFGSQTVLAAARKEAGFQE